MSDGYASSKTVSSGLDRNSLREDFRESQEPALRRIIFLDCAFQLTDFHTWCTRWASSISEAAGRFGGVSLVTGIAIPASTANLIGRDVQIESEETVHQQPTATQCCTQLNPARFWLPRKSGG